MKRFFSAYVFFFGVLALIAAAQPTALGQGKKEGRPEVEFVKPNAVQEKNTIHWEIKFKAKGTTINKVTLDIMPAGGKVSFENPTPLPSGRGDYRAWDDPTVESGVFQEEGKSKKLPPGRYFMYVAVTFNGTKTMRWPHIAVVTGEIQPPIGEIAEDMEFLPAAGLLTNRMRVHGKYTPPPDTDLSVKKFAVTLLAPDGTVKVKDVDTAPKFTHTFTDLPASGEFVGYVRARVIKDGNGFAWVYSTRHEKKVP